jgi:hypothetical protein
MPSTTTCRSRCQYLYVCTSKCVSICTFVLVTERERERDILPWTTTWNTHNTYNSHKWLRENTSSAIKVCPVAVWDHTAAFPACSGAERGRKRRNRSTSRAPVWLSPNSKH